MVRDKPYDAEEQINLLVKNMVLKPRGSPGMSKAEQDELAKLVDSLRNKDEGTASGILVNQLFPQPYSVGGGPKHLERIHNTLFVDECLRRIMKTDDRAAQHARSAVGPLTNPKPDFTFGVAETIFETGHRLTSNSYSNLAGIQKGTLYPFFFVEWKSGATGGTQHSAQSQAARAGAALVHSILQLYAEALLGSASAPKLFNAAYSASFSATIDSDYLVLWVHWLDRSEGVAPGTYQMSVIEKYWLNDGENLWRLRKALKNIFEWGLEERVRNIKELLTDLGTKIQAAPLPASSSEISKSAKSSKSSKSSKRQKT